MTRVALILAGGVWADRLRRHLVMLASDALRAGIQATLAVLLLTGHRAGAGDRGGRAGRRIRLGSDLRSVGGRGGCRRDHRAAGSWGIEGPAFSEGGTLPAPSQRHDPEASLFCHRPLWSPIGHPRRTTGV